jgi:4-amino-4-deoxy-L-arabinose transferase-like glycosyltransferase
MGTGHEGRSAAASSARGGRRLGLVLAALWLAVAIPLLPSYGPTLDESVGELPYGEGLLHWIGSRDVTLEQTLVHPVASPFREPHPHWVYDQPWTDVWPLASFLSAVSCRWVWSGAGWLDAVAAHHLPVPLFVAALVVAMAMWMARRAGPLAAIAAVLGLLTSPRFFADAIHNLKDAPEAALYVLAWFATARAVERMTLRAWALAGVAAAAALAQKANALFLAPQGLAWLLIAARATAPSGPAGDAGDAPRRRPLWLGLAVAFALFVALYFALSPQLWIDPVDHVARMYRHILESGNRVTSNALLVDGAASSGGVSFECASLVLWTTPPLVLVLALVGLFTRRLSVRDRAFLLIGVAVPVGRNLLPGSVNFDGVRHYLEFMPCLALLAGAGADAVVRALARPLATAHARAAALVRAGALALLVAPGAVAVARTHPNGIAYFNAFVGGLPGAQARGVPDSTDYWGNSYWQAYDWLDDHAEPGAVVHVPLFPTIVRPVAHYRLRPDLKLARLGRNAPQSPLYVMYVTRRSWYDRTLRELDATAAPVHQIEVDGAPILRIVRIGEPEAARAALASFTRSIVGSSLALRVAAWSLKDARARAELAAIFAGRRSAGDAETLARLRRLLPAELQGGLEDLLWELDAPR